MIVSLIAELIAAGEVRKAELVELAGGLYMPSYVAAILKIPELLIEEWRKAASLSLSRQEKATAIQPVSSRRMEL